MTNTATTGPSTSQGANPRGEAIAVESVLNELVETRRSLAALEARETELLARACDLAHAQNDACGVVDRRSEIRDIPLRSLAAEIAAALRISDRTVQRRLSDATVLTTRFRATLAALAAGEISRAHVHTIVEAGLPIDDGEVRAAYETAALEIARRETAGRLKPAARLLAGRLHPIPLHLRHEHAARERDVWVRDLDDGMAELIATLPAHIAVGIRDRLDQFARSIIDARRISDGDTGGDRGDAPVVGEAHARDCRRVGQIRADVFADLLLTGHATPEVSNRSLPESDAIVAHVQITVPVMTVLGADTTPAELRGRAPVDTPTALRLAANAPGWDRVLTHPITAGVLAVDRYRPSDHLRRALRVRDEHCRFPGCRIPTARCDVDHTTARQHDGPTELVNLAHLCRRHHVLKHHSAWRVRQTPDGVLHWTSPAGRQYSDRPARTLVFTTDPPATGLG